MKTRKMFMATAASVVALSSLAGTLRAGPILWIDDANGEIGKVDVHTGATTLVGNSGQLLTDLAFDPSGNLWGVTFTDLYKINTTTGAASLVGSMGLSGGNALVFGANGTLYAAANNSTSLFTLNTSTGAATSIGNIGHDSAGDLAFNNGTLYLSDTSNELVQINLSGPVSGSVVGNLGFSSVFGLATGSDGVLYGVSGNSIFSVNTATGAGTLSTTYAGGLGGAFGTAFFNETTSGAGVTPLPSSALMGLLSMAGIAAFAVTRRKLAPAA